MGSKTLATAYPYLAIAVSLFVTPALWSQVGADVQREIHAHTQRAQDALKAGNPDAADHEFRAILALDPNNTDAHGNLGVIRFFRADWTEPLSSSVRS